MTEYVRLTQSGIDTLLEVDPDGKTGTFGFESVMVLKNVNKINLVAFNFMGMDPNPVVGTDASEILKGNSRANLIYAGDGSDTVNGLGGNDTLYGEDGYDTLYGGEGNDRLDGGFYGDTLYGGVGEDTLYGGGHGDSMYGEDGNDYIYASGGSLLSSGAGNDFLYGSRGDDTFDGGEGIDTVSYYGQPGVVANLSIVAAVDIFLNIENIIGSSYVDFITGNAQANRLEGGEGNDTLNGAGGADTLVGGAGDDQYTVDNAGDTVIESSFLGTDTVLSSINYTLTANVENLRLTALTAINGTGNNLNNLITAGTGDNILDGSTGIDTVSYASSSAAVMASLTTRTATGGSGNDSILNFENIAGSNYADNLTGNTQANQLDGAGGSDTLNGGTGADSLTGGSGSDTFFVENTGDVVIETGSDALSGTDTVYASISYTLTANVENLRINSTANINATGNELNNVIFAGAGNNILNGSTGTDTVHYGNTSAGVNVSLDTEAAQATGNSGTDTLISIENLTGSNYNDTLQGSNADNIIEGGTGTDTMSYANASSAVTASLASKSASGGGGNDTLLRIENLIGSSHNDSLTGSSIANNLTAGSGNDSLNGSSGNDTLSGGDGNDSLLGGAGQDQLTGGAGADSFDFNSLAEMGLTSASWDTITDFSGTQGDRMDLSTLDANTTTGGNQSFSYIGSASFTAAGQLRYDAAAGVLYGSVDADLDAEFAIQLVGNPAFVADYLIA
ncbi:MAG: calcium-binding protein [Pseudomonadota bacterium]